MAGHFLAKSLDLDSASDINLFHSQVNQKFIIDLNPKNQILIFYIVFENQKNGLVHGTESYRLLRLLCTPSSLSTKLFFFF